MAMDANEMRELMLIAADIYSSMVLDRHESPGGGYHPSPTACSPSWCICGRCREMPTQPERVSCEKRLENCISRMEDFQVVILDDAVLRLARLYRQMFWQLGKAKIYAKRIVMRHTDNSYYGLMEDWELVSDDQFQAAVSGLSEIDTLTPTANMLDLCHHVCHK